ncbi:MAG: tRNA (N(6)-L-threonylcarbamoyladenosine(37)-C(2))-methylthiotransferase MtaB [Spirochaetota bacterium]
MALINHGCKLNQFEGEAILQALANYGFRVAKITTNFVPDIVIVNTCTVTSKSDRKSRNSIMRAAGVLRGRGLLIVTGCYAETDGQLLRGIDGVNLVVGKSEKSSIPDIVKAYFNRGEQRSSYHPSPFNFDYTGGLERSRVFIKVQDGCNMGCSYCKVPLARGGSVSRDYHQIIESAKRIASRGYREVVLTGIDLGSYCYEGIRLGELLIMLLESTPETLSVRLSSIEPVHFNDELLDAISDSRIAPHFHVPLQSGSDRILSIMKRPYSVSDYFSMVKRIRDVRPTCHIASDIIVGFPSESEGDFLDTLEVIKSIDFSSLHVFKYSVRKGTDASFLRDDVPYCEKVRRSNAVITLGQALNYAYRSRFVGSVLHAIFQKKSNHYIGVTGNYIKVRVNSSEDLERKCLPVLITHAGLNDTSGEVIFSSLPEAGFFRGHMV